MNGTKHVTEDGCGVVVFLEAEVEPRFWHLHNEVWLQSHYSIKVLLSSEHSSSDFPNYFFYICRVFLSAKCRYSCGLFQPSSATLGRASSLGCL
jgi:hypothetical protein